jgi:hypothetical protein
MVVQHALLEEHQYENTGRYGSVCNIEDGLEELELFATKNGEPGGIVTMDNGEVEHIYHLAVKKRGVASAPRDKTRYVKGAFGEDHPVEDGVYEIAHGACQDEGTAKDDASGVAFIDQLAEDEEACYNSYEAEEREDKLAPVGLADLHAEGHAFVLEEMELCPVANDIDLACHARVEMRFDIDLDCLIYKQNEENNNNGCTILHQG